MPPEHCAKLQQGRIHHLTDHTTRLKHRLCLAQTLNYVAMPKAGALYCCVHILITHDPAHTVKLQLSKLA